VDADLHRSAAMACILFRSCGGALEFKASALHPPA
jgi:hypothetical protein